MRMLRRCRVGVAVVVLVVSQLAWVTGVAAAPLFPIPAAGTNGVGHITAPGVACSAGGSGDYRSYALESPVAPGVFSSLAGTFRATIDVHTDSALAAVSGGKNSFLLAANSRATLDNDRGTVQFLLNGQGSGAGIGLCPQASLAFDGTTVTGSGTWTVGGGTGAYRGASGSGTFSLSAALMPGANNAWSLSLDAGTFSILPPALGVSVASTFWGSLGLDYVSRIVSVTYNVTNTGAGDAFNVALQKSVSPTPGVTALGPVPQSLGDIPAGGSAQVTVRYQLGLLQPCILVVLGCNFNTTLTVNLPDALDRGSVQSASAPVTAPNFPPPL
jgi:hypothetical protein